MNNKSKFKLCKIQNFGRKPHNLLRKKATTVTTKPKEFGFEAPAITICPYPAFKPSISEEFKHPARDLFLMPTPNKHLFNNKTVRSLFEEFSYANDIEFLAFDGNNSLPIKEGNTSLPVHEGGTKLEGNFRDVMQGQLQEWTEHSH